MSQSVTHWSWVQTTIGLKRWSRPLGVQGLEFPGTLPFFKYEETNPSSSLGTSLDSWTPDSPRRTTRVLCTRPMDEYGPRLEHDPVLDLRGLLIRFDTDDYWVWGTTEDVPLTRGPDPQLSS